MGCGTSRPALAGPPNVSRATAPKEGNTAPVTAPSAPGSLSSRHRNSLTPIDTTSPHGQMLMQYEPIFDLVSRINSFNHPPHVRIYVSVSADPQVTGAFTPFVIERLRDVFKSDISATIVYFGPLAANDARLANGSMSATRAISLRLREITSCDIFVSVKGNEDGVDHSSPHSIGAILDTEKNARELAALVTEFPILGSMREKPLARIERLHARTVQRGSRSLGVFYYPMRQQANGKRDSLFRKESAQSTDSVRRVNSSVKQRRGTLALTGGRKQSTASAVVTSVLSSTSMTSASVPAQLLNSGGSDTGVVIPGDEMAEDTSRPTSAIVFEYPSPQTCARDLEALFRATLGEAQVGYSKRDSATAGILGSGESATSLFSNSNAVDDAVRGGLTIPEWETTTSRLPIVSPAASELHRMVLLHRQRLVPASDDRVLNMLDKIDGAFTRIETMNLGHMTTTPNAPVIITGASQAAQHNQGPPIVAVCGGGGMGKSAVLASWVRRYFPGFAEGKRPAAINLNLIRSLTTSPKEARRESAAPAQRERPPFIFYHSAGVSGESRSLSHVIARLISDLGAHLSYRIEVPDKSVLALCKFARRLLAAARREKVQVTIVIDDFDRLVLDNKGHEVAGETAMSDRQWSSTVQLAEVMRTDSNTDIAHSGLNASSGASHNKLLDGALHSGGSGRQSLSLEVRGAENVTVLSSPALAMSAGRRATLEPLGRQGGASSPNVRGDKTLGAAGDKLSPGTSSDALRIQAMRQSFGSVCVNMVIDLFSRVSKVLVSYSDRGAETADKWWLGQAPPATARKPLVLGCPSPSQRKDVARAAAARFSADLSADVVDALACCTGSENPLYIASLIAARVRVHTAVPQWPPAAAKAKGAEPKEDAVTHIRALLQQAATASAVSKRECIEPVRVWRALACTRRGLSASDIADQMDISQEALSASLASFLGHVCVGPEGRFVLASALVDDIMMGDDLPRALLNSLGNENLRESLVSGLELTDVRQRLVRAAVDTLEKGPSDVEAAHDLAWSILRPAPPLRECASVLGNADILRSLQNTARDDLYAIATGVLNDEASARAVLYDGVLLHPDSKDDDRIHTLVAAVFDRLGLAQLSLRALEAGVAVQERRCGQQQANDSARRALVADLMSVATTYEELRNPSSAALAYERALVVLGYRNELLNIPSLDMSSSLSASPAAVPADADYDLVVKSLAGLAPHRQSLAPVDSDAEAVMKEALKLAEVHLGEDHHIYEEVKRAQEQMRRRVRRPSQGMRLDAS